MNATVDLHIWEPFIGTEFSIRCVIISFDNDFRWNNISGYFNPLFSPVIFCLRGKDHFFLILVQYDLSDE